MSEERKAAIKAHIAASLKIAKEHAKTSMKRKLRKETFFPLKKR